MSTITSSQRLFAEPIFSDSLEDFSTVQAPFTLTPVSTGRVAKPKIAYASVIIGGIFAIVVAQLLLSIGLSNGAYEIESLQTQQKELDRTNSALNEKLDGLSSPQNLATSAEAMGMVANSNPVYLRLSDGTVSGSPSPASGAAGSVTHGQADLTPNAFTTGSEQPGQITTPSVPPSQAGPPTVPWQGELPSPTTH